MSNEGINKTVKKLYGCACGYDILCRRHIYGRAGRQGEFQFPAG